MRVEADLFLDSEGLESFFYLLIAYFFVAAGELSLLETSLLSVKLSPKLEALLSNLLYALLCALLYALL